MNGKNRVLLIIERLKKGNKVNVKALAIEFNVSTRTIQRDLNEDIPNIINYDIISKNNLYYLKNSSRNENENITINILLKDAKKHGNNFYQDTVALFDNYKDTKRENTIYSKVNTELLEDIRLDMIQIQNAILNKNIITCTYNQKFRKVAPLKIANFDGYWYLVVKDFAKDSVNTYYFKGIQNIILLEETYKNICKNLQYKLDCAINAFFVSNKESFYVLLFADAKVANYFERKEISKSQRIIKKYEDGSMDIEIYISHEMEIIPLVQMYLPYIKVTEPNWIWEKIINNIKLIK